MLTGNLEKIAEHGRRADGIVKSMLAHSRGGSDDWQPSDINALVEDALNLAYHSARAHDQNFNITMERDFAAGIPPVELVPQDLTRVFLNLFGNGFYAADKRRHEAADGFQSVLKVTTRDLGNEVEIRVRDNGTGIAPEFREKLFQPFFTTKPPARAPGSACRSAGTSSPSSIAERSPSTARSASSPNSRSAFRAPGTPAPTLTLPSPGPTRGSRGREREGATRRSALT
jgi:signal transduction histidine kinase